MAERGPTPFSVKKSAELAVTFVEKKMQLPTAERGDTILEAEKRGGSSGVLWRSRRCCGGARAETEALAHGVKRSDLRWDLERGIVSNYRNWILPWDGHVTQIPMTRAPRQLLTGWVAHSRPNGYPEVTFGHQRRP
jgi:hypothetical protein